MIGALIALLGLTVAAPTPAAAQAVGPERAEAEPEETTTEVEGEVAETPTEVAEVAAEVEAEAAEVAAEPDAEPEVAAEAPSPVAAPDPVDEPVPVPGPPSDRPRAKARASVTEGFGVDSADGRFGLSLGMLASLRYGVDVVDGEADHGFQLRLARIMVQGHLWGDRLLFQLQPEFAGSPRLLDANATIALHPAFSLLVGQFRPWFTRGFPTNLPVQMSLDRGPVLDAFRVDRDVGLTVLGRPLKGRLEYYVGVLDGEGITRGGPRNPQPLLTARLVGAPLGAMGYSHTTAANAEHDLPFRFALGLGAATNEVDRTETTIDPVSSEVVELPLPSLRTVTVGGDVALQGWRMQAMGEGLWRLSQPEGGDSDSAWGAYGQVSIVAVRRRLELATRAGVMDLEGDAGPQVPIEPGLNVYLLGDHAKLQLRYRCLLSVDQGECSHGAHLQGQLWF